MNELNLANTVREDVIVGPEITRIYGNGATMLGARMLLANADRPAPLEIVGPLTFTKVYRTHMAQGAWCIGPIQDQNVRSYNSLAVRNVLFKDLSAHCFHAYSGKNAPSVWGNLTFEDLTFYDLGYEALYVKGPKVGDITCRRIRKTDTRTTGWATDHTGFAGDLLDFNNADAFVPWDATIEVDRCDLRYAGGAALVAGAKRVRLTNSKIIECWDKVPNAMSVWSLHFDAQQADTDILIDNCVLKTTRYGSALRALSNHLAGGVVNISHTEIEVDGPGYFAGSNMKVILQPTSAIVPTRAGKKVLTV